MTSDGQGRYGKQIVSDLSKELKKLYGLYIRVIQFMLDENAMNL
jgi:hypothetical protein